MVHAKLLFLSSWRSHVLFSGSLLSLFWVSGDVSSECSDLFAFCGGECTVHSLRSTSGATPAKLLAASIAGCFCPCHASAEVGVDSDLNGQSPRQKMNTLPLCQRPGYNYIKLNLYMDVCKLSLTHST